MHIHAIPSNARPSGWTAVSGSLYSPDLRSFDLENYCCVKKLSVGQALIQLSDLGVRESRHEGKLLAIILRPRSGQVSPEVAHCVALVSSDDKSAAIAQTDLQPKAY